MANANLNMQFQEPGDAVGPTDDRAPFRVVKDETPQAIAGGLLRRGVANFIDSMISAIVLLPINILVIMAAGASARAGVGDFQAMMMPAYLIATAVKWAAAIAFTLGYYGYFYRTRGATPGKQLMGLKVVQAENGTYLTYKQTFFRETFGKGLFILTMIPFMLGFFLAVFRKDKRAVHDLLFKTQVLRYNR